jgi:hypothetical protein
MPAEESPPVCLSTAKASQHTNLMEIRRRLRHLSTTKARQGEAMADEIAGRFLGPIEVKDFFAVRDAKGEAQMYKPFVRFASDFAPALALIHFAIKWMS